jgi:small-conductance mechanosensitive channel
MQSDPLKAARPHLVRAGLAAGVAFAAGLGASQFGQLQEAERPSGAMDPATEAEIAIAILGALLVLIAGILAVRSLGAAIRTASAVREEDPRGASLAFVVSVVGYLIIIVATMGVLGVNLEGLLLGGALTGVVLGIAAQQTIGNFFAGIVLLAARPFTIGEHVVLRSGPIGGEYEGRITDMSLFYVHMMTEQGTVALPNAAVLASAVGPGAKAGIADPREGPDPDS